MPRTQTKWASVGVFVIIHLIAVVALFNFSWKGFWTFIFLSWVTGCLGICTSYHRHLTHRSFEVWKPLEYFLAFCGCLALQNGPIKWVATHRLHHARSDQPKDPHSPTKGFWWAHMGWLFAFVDELDDYEQYKKYAPDLAKKPVYRFMDKYFAWSQVPLGIALYFWGGVPMILWGIFARLIFVWHSTWLVNSAAHIWGYRTWATQDQSTNNWWVALLTFGEGWHNNHHAFLRSARHGLQWWEFDLTYWTIVAFRTLGLASKIQLPTEELKNRFAQKTGNIIPNPTVADSYQEVAA